MLPGFAARRKKQPAFARAYISVKIDDASRMISLLTRMDKLRLSSARQRLKLLAAATFNCRLG